MTNNENEEKMTKKAGNKHETKGTNKITKKSHKKTKKMTKNEEMKTRKNTQNKT